MKKILIALVALTLAGCTRLTRDIDDVVAFSKHNETGLCFFGEDWDRDGKLDSGTAGNVPCTPEVEAWIENHR